MGLLKHSPNTQNAPKRLGPNRQTEEQNRTVLSLGGLNCRPDLMGQRPQMLVTGPPTSGDPILQGLIQLL